MNRKKVGRRWNIQADIFFRFNPKKFGDEVQRGRTLKANTKIKYFSLSQSNSSSGAQERT